MESNLPITQKWRPMASSIGPTSSSSSPRIPTRVNPSSSSPRIPPATSSREDEGFFFGMIKSVVNTVAGDKLKLGSKEYLCKLMGVKSIDDEIALFLPLLKYYLPQLPLDFDTVLVYVLHNLSLKIYTNEMALKPGETITFDRFIADVVDYLYGIFSKGIAKLNDNDKITQDSFQTLAEELCLDIIPYKTGSIIIPLIRDKLFDGYSSLFLKANSEEVTKKEKFILSQDFLDLLAFSIGNAQLQKEKMYLRSLTQTDELFLTLSSLINGLVRDNSKELERKLREQMPALENLSTERLGLAIQATVLKLLGNALRNTEASLGSPEDILARPWEYARNVFAQMFDNANKLYQNEKFSKPDHYKAGISNIARILLDRDPLVDFVLKRCPDLCEMLFQKVQEFHQAFKLDDRAEYEQHLRVVLWDSAELKKLNPGLDIPDVPDESSSNLLGTEKFVKQMRNIFDNFIGPMGLKYIQGMDSSGQKAKEWALAIFNKQENSPIHQFLKKNIADLLFKMLVILLEKGKNEPGATKNSALFHALRLILKAFSEKSPQLGGFNFPLNDADRFQLTKDFQPLAQALVELLCTRHGKLLSLPLPASEINKLIESIKKEYLPAFLCNMYETSHAWIHSKQVPIAGLKKIYSNQRLPEAAKFLSEFVTQFLPFYLRIETKTSNSFVVDSMKDLMLTPGQSEDHLKQFKVMMHTAIKKLGTSPDKEIALPFEFIGKYVEPFLLHIFYNVASALKNIDNAYIEHSNQHEGAPTVRIAKIFVDEACDHYSKVNSIKELLRQSHASQVPDAEMRTRFAARLHPLLADDGREAEYHKKISGKFLPLILRGEKIPAPDFLEKGVWNLLETGILPLIAGSLIYESKAPHSIQNYLNSLLKLIMENWEKDKQGSKKLNEFSTLFNDPLQREIESLLGDLLQELIGLQPSLAQPFIHFRSLWKRAGHEMGQSLRSAMEHSRLHELFEQMICNALPFLHEGAWVTAGDMERYEKGAWPRFDDVSNADLFFPVSQNEAGVKTKGWDFQFAKDKAEYQAQQDKWAEDRAKLRTELDERLAKMIEYQGYRSFDATLKTLWNDFQISLDKAIDAAFGKAGARLKKILDAIFNFIWNYGLKHILEIVFYPIKKIIEAILHRYFIHQANVRVGDVASPIHQNLFLHALDKTVDFLAASHKSAQPVAT